MSVEIRNPQTLKARLEVLQSFYLGLELQHEEAMTKSFTEVKQYLNRIQSNFEEKMMHNLRQATEAIGKHRQQDEDKKRMVLNVSKEALLELTDGVVIASFDEPDLNTKEDIPYIEVECYHTVDKIYRDFSDDIEQSIKLYLYTGSKKYTEGFGLCLNRLLLTRKRITFIRNLLAKVIAFFSFKDWIDPDASMHITDQAMRKLVTYYKIKDVQE